MKPLVSFLSPEQKKELKKKAQPTFIPPMLATLTQDYFSDEHWIYEHKFDGERCLAFKKNGNVTLKSRNNRVINDEFPELVTALQKQKADNFIIDGEIISIGKHGISDFELLQGRMHVLDQEKISTRVKNSPITYCIFDLIYVDGYDVRNVPLFTRKKILKSLLSYTQVLQYTTHQVGDGLSFFKKACKLNWEGLIAKKFDSTYEGKRSRNWLKFKCIMKQELVIGGFTKPKGSRSYFGALLVGYYEKNKFCYAGKVGTGYNEETLEELGKKLQKLAIKKCPFHEYSASTKDITWVKPIIVAEFEFAQWTTAGRLRVGRYKGLRDDKKAQDVVREKPKAIVHTKAHK